MSDELFERGTIPLDAQIACVNREIGMRQVVYPRRVADKKMSQKKMDDEIACMKAVKESLHRLAWLEK